MKPAERPNKEEITMMTKTVKNYATANIFGPYILRMRQIPGRKCVNTSRDKEREKQLFQVIDDYVEQA